MPRRDLQRTRAWLLLATALVASAATAADDAFARFVALWPGDYSNAAQVSRQEAARVPEPERNRPLRLHIRRVELPAFGEHVMYAEWRAEGEAVPVRQRIYSLRRGAEPGTYVLQLHIWRRDDAAFVGRTTGAYADPARLEGVTPADMLGLQGCDVTFTARGDAFEGRMRRGTCRFPSFENPDELVYSWSQMRLARGEFRYRDAWYHLDDRPYREFRGEWYDFRALAR